MRNCFAKVRNQFRQQLDDEVHSETHLQRSSATSDGTCVCGAAEGSSTGIGIGIGTDCAEHNDKHVVSNYDANDKNRIASVKEQQHMLLMNKRKHADNKWWRRFYSKTSTTATTTPTTTTTSATTTKNTKLTTTATATTKDNNTKVEFIESDVKLAMANAEKSIIPRPAATTAEPAAATAKKTQAVDEAIVGDAAGAVCVDIAGNVVVGEGDVSDVAVTTISSDLTKSIKIKSRSDKIVNATTRVSTTNSGKSSGNGNGCGNSSTGDNSRKASGATLEHSGSYIDEYKTFVEDKRQSIAIATPYPTVEAFNFEQALNESAGKSSQPSLKSLKTKHTLKLDLPTPETPDLCHDFTIGEAASISRTPEELEYEATAAAESSDVMTPLPSSTFSAHTLGRSLHPEVAEAIRSLDAHALRINNLTVEDKMELIRRFDSTQQRKHGRSMKYATHFPNHTDSFTESSSVDENDEAHVELRRKVKPPWIDQQHHHRLNTSLYERRLPRSPKLKLMCGQGNDADDECEKNLMDLKYPTVLPPNPQLKALLVFHKSDNICEVLTQACHRQHLEVTVVKTKEAALDTLSTTNATTTTECYHLIIIDARSTKYLDAEYITRSIRHTHGHHFTTIIAVVKKSFFEKDDVFIALLDAGVNRCMAETTNLALCSIELKQILHSIVRPHNVMSTQQALYTALHRLKEVLIITDDVLRIQYANKSAERLLNMRLDEIISKPLADIFVSDVSSISAHGKSVREFDGILTVRRKSQDGIPMHVRVVPVACIGRTPTHFVFNFDVPGGQNDFIATLPQPKEAPRGSLHSIRRGSFDVRSVASDGLRRTSLAKLTSLPLEAPITKIINLLSQVQENCSADEARLIDKVLEFLKREGLYSPQMKEIRPDDPIATDLIGALLTGPSLYSSRRSSNDSIIRVSTRPSGIMPAKMKATPLIMELLEESLCWEFDIFKLEEITERRPLLYLGMEMFRRFDVFASLNIEENVCKSWLAVIEAHYHAQNSYHNSTHAADVMQATGAFITQLAAKDMVMDRMDEAVALIAAAAHDIDHPGRSSAFLCNSNSPLAILYNDLTVLESHHAATTFKLTLDDDKINIFKNLDKDTYKSVRSTIIDMILATEMTRHFEHLAKFVSVFGTDVEPRDIVQTEDESSILIRRMLIKVADVSNPARPTAFCVEWARRIAEEYFTQTDEEKAKALPIVMPMFDRATCSIPKSQIGFIEYIIQDMMHAWDSFIDMPQLITYMQINYSQWKKYEEQGIHTLADIKAKQVSLNAKKTTCK